MTSGDIIRRLFVPPIATSMYAYWRFGCRVSFRTELEITEHLKLGRKVDISSYCKIKAKDGELSIGERTSISPFTCLAAGAGGLYIGSDCMLGPSVTIVSSNHKYEELGLPINQQGFKSTGIWIGDDVWISSGCVVLDGAKIGSGSIITPNSVVSTEIPEYSIAAGNPAKVIFKRR